MTTLESLHAKLHDIEHEVAEMRAALEAIEMRPANGARGASNGTPNLVVPADATEDVEGAFRRLAALWREETGPLSIEARKVVHPAYQGIIALGPAAIPLLLNELQHNPDHWFTALETLTGEDPARQSLSFDEAVAAWLRWGEAKGYLSP